jgi:circadian clock protein KaiC
VEAAEGHITDRGINLCDVYLGPEGVLTGSARRTQGARERAATLVRQQDMECKRNDLERKRQAWKRRSPP